MRTLERRVTRKGQVTIPISVRRMLGLKPGDRVRYRAEDGQAIVERAESTLLAGYSAVPPIDRPEGFATRRREFEQGAAEEARLGLKLPANIAFRRYEHSASLFHRR